MSVRRILFTPIFLAALHPFLFAQTKLAEVDLQVSGVESGTSYGVLLRKFGKPASRKSVFTERELSCTGSDITNLTLRYSGLEIVLVDDGYGRNFEVVEIVVTSNRWQASGIRIGAGPNEIVRRFGKPNSREKRGDRMLYQYVTPGNLGTVNFEFRSSKLVKIVMSETLC